MIATGADATVRVTIEPLSASSSDSGDCESTVPAATEPSASRTMSTKNPALTRVFLACVSFLPTTSGTGILPFETVTLIKVPMSTTVLAAGSCPKIVPSGLSLSIGVTRPRSKSASVRINRASSTD